MSIKVRVMRTAGVLTGLEAKSKRITKLVGGYKTKCHENAQLLTEIEPDQSQEPEQRHGTHSSSTQSSPLYPSPA